MLFAGKFAEASQGGLMMNDPRLMWSVSRGLRYLCLAAIVGVTVAGCPSPSPNAQNAPSGGSSAPPASGGSSAPPASGSSAPPASNPAIGTDTGSNKLALRSGTGSGGGSSGLSVPVEASAYGSATTVPFMVNSSTLSVYYYYDCSSTGGSGFTADMISGSPDNPGSDDESIADVPDPSGSDTVTVNPQDTPGEYYLQVNSQCDWTIVVQNG